MSTEEHASDIETRLRNDMLTTLRRNGMDVAEDAWLDTIVDELVADAMHQVTLLLTRVDWHE